MPKMAAYTAFLLFACLAVASAAPAHITADCVSSSLLTVAGLNVYPATHQIYSTQTTYLNDRTTVQVADNFEVTYYNTFKVVTAKYNSTLSETYVLYQCGTPVPSLAGLGLEESTKVFSVPLTSISAPDTSALYFLKLLGVLDRVSYVTPYAVEPCMQYLGSSQCNRSDSAATSDAINAKFIFGLDTTDSEAVLFRATADPGPLNRAEYIKFLATFFNKEATANTVFQGIADSYDNTKRQAKTYLANNANATAPLVAWLYYNPEATWGTTHYDEFISIKFAQYRRDLTADAGGRLHNLTHLAATYADGKNVMALTDEIQFLNPTANGTRDVLRTILQDVDVVIDESYYAGNPNTKTFDSFRTMYGLTSDADLAAFKFLRDGRVLRLDGQASSSGTTAWYEEAVAQPDLVLRDLSAAFLPQASLTYSDSTSTHLVRPLAASTVLSSSASSGLPTSTVLLETADSCPVTKRKCTGVPQPICPAVYLDCSGKLVSATATATPLCAPDCSSTPLGGGGSGGGGSAGRAAVAMGVMLALIAVALAVVLH